MDVKRQAGALIIRLSVGETEIIDRSCRATSLQDAFRHLEGCDLPAELMYLLLELRMRMEAPNVRLGGDESRPLRAVSC